MAVLNEAVVDLRNNLKTLHAGTSKPVESLSDLLKHVAADPHYTAMVNIELDVSLPDHSSLSPLRSGHLMRIVNEAMSNILRHAQARNVLIRAQGQDERLRLTITDDGVGFAAGSHSGYGIQNMRDRARLLNGNLDIDAKPEKGTTLVLDIPWMDER